MQHLCPKCSRANIRVSKDATVIRPAYEWYRVQLNTVVRSGKDLDSERIRILPMGTRVRVVEVCKRRVRIEEPAQGWCSMRSANGDIILKQMDVDEEDLSTPRFGSNASNQAELLREKIAKVKEQQRRAKMKMGKAKEVPEVRALAEEHSKLSKMLRNKALEKSALPTSPRGMKARLIHTQSCISLLEFENSEKECELAGLQQQLGGIRAQIHSVCQKQGVDNPLELTAQIEEMDLERRNAREKIKEYQVVTERYERELTSMKQKMTGLLKKDPLSRMSSFVDNVELHNGDVVMLKGDIGIAIIHFIGYVHWRKDEVFVGVELGAPVGTCDGTVDQTTYFSVGHNQGAFYPLRDVARKIPAASLLKQLQQQVQLNGLLLNSRE